MSYLWQPRQADDASGSKSNVTAFFPEALTPSIAIWRHALAWSSVFAVPVQEMQRLGKLRWDGLCLVAGVCVYCSRT